jgi:PAS domain S-box-containing protein
VVAEPSPIATECSSALFDSIADPIVVLDAAGRLRQWNRALIEQTGYTDGDLSSTELDGLFADAGAVRAAVDEALETGTARVETALLTAVDTRIDHEFTAAEHTESTADAGVVVCVGRERTEGIGRHDRTASHYETVLDTLVDAVYAIGSDGTIAYVNESYAEMKGVPREELLGTDIDSWVSDEAVEKADEMRSALERDERDAGVVEYEFVTADGERFPAELRCGEVPHSDSELARAGTIRDVTDRVERERTLRRQNERLDEFASIVSHDLRNPLTVAEGRLELVRKECDSEQLDAVEDAHDRMWALIDDLLALSRHGRIDPECTDVSLRTIARSCWGVVDCPTATLAVETDRDLRADERQLRRLLENLFRNAVEHGGEDVTVTVDGLADGFVVADDGPGIPTDSRDRVFDTGYSTSDEGTGFGLSIVRDIAEAHGWDVTVAGGQDGRKEDGDHGARFEVRGVTIV